MSKIDQAFVKAFAKKRSPTVPAPTESAPTESGPVDLASLGMSSFWVDPSNSDWLRADEPQPQPLTAPAEGRRRGARPGVTIPIIELLRVDAAQQQPPAQHFLRTRLDASAFPAITVTHDAPENFQDFAAPESPAVASSEATVVPESASLESASLESASLQSAVEAEFAEEFEAAWEVDRFEIPPIVEQLLTHGGMISAAGIPLAQAARDGMQAVLITSSHRGAGRSTLAIGLALAAATTGLRVALVDGDWKHPSLADDLQLELEFGWPEAIRGGVAISETAVHSVGDAVTLFPILASAAGLPPRAEELHRTIDQLRPRFDLILVDGPSSDEPLPSDCFDSGILVRDLRKLDQAAQDRSIAALRQRGIPHIGIAENFADE